MSNIEYITRWVVSLDEDGDIDLKRQLVPEDAPLDILVSKPGNYKYTAFSIMNQHFTILYDEKEELTNKSVIYVGKLIYFNNEEYISDLTEDDEEFIEIIADIFLRERTAHLH